MLPLPVLPLLVLPLPALVLPLLQGCCCAAVTGALPPSRSSAAGVAVELLAWPGISKHAGSVEQSNNSCIQVTGRNGMGGEYCGWRASFA